MTEQMIEALFRGGKPTIEPVQQVVEYRLSLTPAQAHALYNDIYVIARDYIDATIVGERQGRFPALFSVYDALYNVGVDGSGPSF